MSDELAALPDWPPGTVAVLATVGAEVHAVPVSTALCAGPRLVLLALASTRGTLARLARDPRCALAVLAAGDVAVTAHGHARVAADPLPGVPGVVAVRLDVERVRDHGRPAFRIEGGVAWQWLEPAAERRDADVRRALAALATRLAGAS